MARVIEVIISAQGETTVQTRGYVGDACTHASAFLEGALGLVVTDHKTAEFYQEASQTQQIQQ